MVAYLTMEDFSRSTLSSGTDKITQLAKLCVESRFMKCLYHVHVGSVATQFGFEDCEHRRFQHGGVAHSHQAYM